MTEYFEIFETLTAAKVRYLICGGLAVNIFGIPRMTADIDLLVDFDTENLREFHKQISRLNYQSRIPLPIIQLATKEKRNELLQTKNLIAYSYFSTQANFVSVDVLMDVPFEFSALWNRKEIRQLKNTEIYLVSMEDLIAMKQYSNRLQDQKDVLLLSKLKNNGK